jgi:predicted dinucleotide-binding enzyme
MVAELAPGANVIKSLNTVFASRLAEDPIKGDARRVVFVSGDDLPSKESFRALLESLGFASLDLGGLAEGSRLQQVPGGAFAGADLLRRV